MYKIYFFCDLDCVFFITQQIDFCVFCKYELAPRRACPGSNNHFNIGLKDVNHELLTLHIFYRS